MNEEQNEEVMVFVVAVSMAQQIEVMCMDVFWRIMTVFFEAEYLLLMDARAERSVQPSSYKSREGRVMMPAIIVI